MLRPKSTGWTTCATSCGRSSPTSRTGSSPCSVAGSRCPMTTTASAVTRGRACPTSWRCCLPLAPMQMQPSLPPSWPLPGGFETKSAARRRGAVKSVTLSGCKDESDHREGTHLHGTRRHIELVAELLPLLCSRLRCRWGDAMQSSSRHCQLLLSTQHTGSNPLRLT